MGMFNKFFLFILGVPFVFFLIVSMLSSFTSKDTESDKGIQITCIHKSDCGQDK